MKDALYLSDLAYDYAARSMGRGDMAKYAYHRLDGNHVEIVQALQARGATVYPIGRPVDLLVGYGGVNYLIEVKMPKGKLSEWQLTFFEGWHGDVSIVTTVADALAVVGLPI